MSEVFSKRFVRLSWITLVFIYLVVIAGSFVRITGSGMGCPDWPKCFGQWVPPTEASVLPDNYQDLYSEKRHKKVVKFVKLLRGVGLESEAKKLEDNLAYILIEEEFNARKTWTEYINRLFGFVAGNLILLTFFWILWKYRTRRLVAVSGVNLVILVFQAWFGSIVVATNLVPWTITVHMLLALVIIGLQLYIIRLISPSQQREIKVSSALKWLIIGIFAVTFIQMFLGTQVREEIDFLRKSGVARQDWSDHFSVSFFIHRSFSWIVLILIAGMYWINRKRRELRIVHWAFWILVVELLSGILLAHFNMPGLVQTAHLLFACVLFGILMMASLRLKSA
jgi:heme a synthase